MLIKYGDVGCGIKHLFVECMHAFNIIRIICNVNGIVTSSSAICLITYDHQFSWYKRASIALNNNFVSVIVGCSTPHVMHHHHTAQYGIY
jgi:hypothetical protein